MKILITGATGLIGSELCTLLLQNGIAIHYLTTSKKKVIREANYHGFYWNPEQGVIDENCLIGVDAIIHLAGASIAKRWTECYKQEIIESRILSANTLFKALKDNPHQVQQIISASAIGIYPNSSTAIYSEDANPEPEGFLSNVVIKWEESIDKFQMLDIKVCKLRTGIVFAKNGGALQQMAKPVRLGLGSAYGNGQQIVSFIHIHDLAAMYRFALENSWEGVYNAVTPEPVSNNALLHAIAAQLGKRLLLPNLPKWLLQLIMGEQHQLLFSDQNISAQKASHAGFRFQFPTVKKALSECLE